MGNYKLIRYLFISMVVGFNLFPDCFASNNNFSLTPYQQQQQYQAALYNAATENFLDNQSHLPTIPESEDEQQSDNDSDDDSESDISPAESFSETSPQASISMFPFMDSQAKQPDFFELGLNDDYQIIPFISSDYVTAANDLYNSYIQTGDIYLSSESLENQLRLLAIVIYWKLNKKDERLKFIIKFINELLTSFSSVEALMLLGKNETLDRSISNNLFLPFVLNIIDINNFILETNQQYAKKNILEKCLKYNNKAFTEIILGLLSSNDIKIKRLTCINLLDENLIGHVVWKTNYDVFRHIYINFDEKTKSFAKQQINLAKKLYIGNNKKMNNLNKMSKLLN